MGVKSADFAIQGVEGWHPVVKGSFHSSLWRVDRSQKSKFHQLNSFETSAFSSPEINSGCGFRLGNPSFPNPFRGLKTLKKSFGAGREICGFCAFFSLSKGIWGGFCCSGVDKGAFLRKNFVKKPGNVGRYCMYRLFYAIIHRMWKWGRMPPSVWKWKTMNIELEENKWANPS